MTALEGGGKDGEQGIRVILFLMEKKADVAVNDVLGVKIVLVFKVKPSAAVVVGQRVETFEGRKVFAKGDDDAGRFVLPLLSQRGFVFVGVHDLTFLKRGVQLDGVDPCAHRLFVIEHVDQDLHRSSSSVSAIPMLLK